MMTTTKKMIVDWRLMQQLRRQVIKRRRRLSEFSATVKVYDVAQETSAMLFVAVNQTFSLLRFR